MSICSIGVFGSAYKRDELVPDSIILALGEKMTLTVPHIYTEYDSGMPHEIHLRLSNSTLTSLVTFSEQISHTLVNFNSFECIPS